MSLRSCTQGSEIPSTFLNTSSFLNTNKITAFCRCLDAIEKATHDPTGILKSQDALEVVVGIVQANKPFRLSYREVRTELITFLIQNFVSNKIARMLFGVKPRMQVRLHNLTC